jgi:alpha-N-arabinofuranosidase
LGQLLVNASSKKLADRKSPTMICRWATENRFEASTFVKFAPKTTDDLAGLVLFQDDDHNIAFGVSLNAQGRPCVKIITRCGDSEHVQEQILNSSIVLLKVIADGKGNYDFLVNGTYVGKSVSADNLSTKTAGNFTGTAVGIYATSKY